MKKILTIIAIAFSLGSNAQTVGDKNTEVGYDLGQKVIDGGATVTIKYSGSPRVFDCYTISAPIPADANQLGSTQNFYYYCSKNTGAIDTTFVAATPRDTIVKYYKEWLALQPYTEVTIADSTGVK